jgi:hypothetical protein
MKNIPDKCAHKWPGVARSQIYAYSGDVGQSWSEATLVVSYISYVAHMSQEKGK